MHINVYYRSKRICIKKSVIEKIPSDNLLRNFGNTLYELQHTHFIEAMHYNGNWEVLRQAKPVEELNWVTKEWLDSLMEEADEIIERWAG